jgi:hypothetical protein
MFFIYTKKNTSVYYNENRQDDPDLISGRISKHHIFLLFEEQKSVFITLDNRWLDSYDCSLFNLVEV